MPANITSSQLRAARAILKMEQKALAELSGVSIPTIKRLEGGEGPLSGNVSTTSRIINALEAAGVTFLADGETTAGGVGVRLANDGQKA